MAEGTPILRVTVGMTVYTRDGAKIGKVREVTGEAFKVETGLFQRDYWLAAESIGSAVPGDVVTLAIDNSGLASHKMKEPHAA
ncbi:MAG: hypothetical protein GEU73_09640 [Chloroflexi bacterium]|nr:hypothetical protein [Chloroflexota bacterium]